MKFDGYKIPGGGEEADQAYGWYAVLVFCGRRPSAKFCSTAEDLNSTPVSFNFQSNNFKFTSIMRCRSSGRDDCRG